MEDPQRLDAKAMDRYVGAVAKRDPVGAAALFEEIAAASIELKQRPMSVDDLLRHRAFEDAAAAWLARPPEDLVSESVESFLNMWREQDPEVALDWVEATLQPEQKIYDRMRQTVGGTLTDLGRDAEALEAYLAAPDDQQVADHRWRSLFYGWHEAEAEAAREGFETTGLPFEGWEKWVTP